MQYKYPVYILFLLISMTILVRCGKSDNDIPAVKDDKEQEDDNDDDDDDITDPEASDSLTIIMNGENRTESSSITLDNTQDAILVVIKSESEWTVASDSEWLKHTAYSGDDQSMGFIAGALKNESIPRSGKITISTTEENHVIHVNQRGAPFIDFSVNGADFRMMRVEGGTFRFGDNNIADTSPAHEVTLSTFYMGQTEVTYELWLAIVDDVPFYYYERAESFPGDEKMNHPLSIATWHEINDNFLPALNRQTEFNFRLPTEAEWEYAATGGQKSEGHLYAGSDTIDHVGWYFVNTYNRETSSREKQAVKLLLPNELGLYDITGNVSEWCSNWYDENGYNSDNNINPTGPEHGEERVVRGGSYWTQLPAFSFSYDQLWVKFRDSMNPDCTRECTGNNLEPGETCFAGSCSQVGFRLVLSF